MLKRLFTMLVVMLVAGAVTLSAGQHKPLKARVLDESAANSGQVSNALSTNIAAGLEKTTVGTATVVGGSWYDYSFNSGGPTYLVYWKGSSYMIFVGKPTTAAKRTVEYVYTADGTTFTTAQQVVDSSVQSTYFSGVDVFRGGAADGFGCVAAGWAGSGNSYFGLESGKGLGGFTPAIVTADRDCAVLTLDSLGTVLVKDSRGRADYKFHKSTDFGTTWTKADTAVVHDTPLPGGQTFTTLDVPIFRFPNGDIGMAATVTGIGDLAPAGTIPLAKIDSVSLFGYYRSTNKGTSWAWNTIAHSGAQLLPDYYYWPANFDQFDMLADKNNNVHTVFNGYGLHFKVTSGDTTSNNETIDVVYWDATHGYKSLVSFDRTDSNLAQVIALRAGNALGCSYPSIAISDDGNVIVCSWSQPNFKLHGFNSTDTAVGTVRYDMWYNWSKDGGATWAGAQALTTTTDKSETFGMMAENLQTLTTPANTYRARIIYIGDVHPGQGVFGGVAGLEPIYYHQWDITTTGVRSEPGVATSFTLEQNYPNPFNPSTKIEYSIQKNTFVTLKVYNVLGQEVATLFNGDQAAGKYSADFDGSKLASGVYVYRIQAGNFSDVKKMMLTK